MPRSIGMRLCNRDASGKVTLFEIYRTATLIETSKRSKQRSIFNRIFHAVIKSVRFNCAQNQINIYSDFKEKKSKNRTKNSINIKTAIIYCK